MAFLLEDAARLAAIAPPNERLISTCHDLLAYAGKQGMSLAELCDHIRRTGKCPLPGDDAKARKLVEEALSSSDQFVLFLNRYTLRSVFVTGSELRRGAPQNVVAVQSDGRASSVSGCHHRDGDVENGGDCGMAVAAFRNQHDKESPGENLEEARCKSGSGVAGAECKEVLSGGGVAMSSPGSAHKRKGERGSAGTEERGLLRCFATLDLKLNAPPDSGEEAGRAEPELDQGASTTFKIPTGQQHDWGPHKAFPFDGIDNQLGNVVDLKSAVPGGEWSNAQLKLLRGCGSRENMPLTSFVLGKSRMTDDRSLLPTARDRKPATPLERSSEFLADSTPSQRPSQPGNPLTSPSPPDKLAGALGLLQAYDSDEEGASDERSDSGERGTREVLTSADLQRAGVSGTKSSGIVEDEGQSAEEESGVVGRSACKRCGVSIPGGRKVCDEHSGWASRRPSKRRPLPPEKEDSSEGDESGLGAEESEPPLAKCKRCEDEVEPGLRLCAKHNSWTRRRQIAQEADERGAKAGGVSLPGDPSSAEEKCYIVVGDRRNFCESHGQRAELCKEAETEKLTTRSLKEEAKGAVKTRSGAREVEGVKARKETDAVVGYKRKRESTSKGKCEKCERDARPGSTLCKWHKGGVTRSERDKRLRKCEKCERDVTPGSALCAYHKAWVTRTQRNKERRMRLQMEEQDEDREERRQSAKGGAAAGAETGGEERPTCRHYAHGKRTCIRPRLEGSKLCREHYACLPGAKRLTMGEEPTRPAPTVGVKRRASGEPNRSEKRRKVNDDEKRVAAKTLREVKKLGGMSVALESGKRKAADAVRAKYAGQRAKRARKGAAGGKGSPLLTSPPGRGDVSGKRVAGADVERRCVVRDGKRTWQCREAAVAGERRCRHHADQYEEYKRRWQAKAQLAREERVGGVTSSANAAGSKGRKREKGEIVRVSRGGRSSGGGAGGCVDCRKPALRGRVRCRDCNDANNRQSALWRARQRGARDGGQGGTQEKAASKGVGKKAAGTPKRGKVVLVTGERKCTNCKSPALEGKPKCAKHAEIQRLYWKRWYAARKSAGQAAKGPLKRKAGQRKVLGREGANSVTAAERQGRMRSDILEVSESGVTETGGRKAGGGASASPPVGGTPAEPVDPPAGETKEGAALFRRCQRERIVKGELVPCGNEAEEGEELCELHSDWMQQQLAKRRAKVVGSPEKGSGTAVGREKEGAEEAKDGTLGNGSGNGVGRTAQGAEEAGDGKLGKKLGSRLGRKKQGAEEANDGTLEDGNEKGLGRTKEGSEEADDGSREDQRIEETGNGAALLPELKQGEEVLGARGTRAKRTRGPFSRSPCHVSAPWSPTAGRLPKHLVG
ncbi:hypothetical protein KFL_000180560 [Klebsormidium nitens]|uniref:WRC domain-containing protein n=1 Tax=Klebsormidium nitens TaxID=105231 RepID=A0A1Y1HJQ0_KLENI|nr:hypothetical protein KFL_000180560 [Klebsormidium nitens]|eukprot:GAQ78774.1 hypothetical protein KFL_000180560 [Klebsormidium nitens]